MLKINERYFKFKANAENRIEKYDILIYTCLFLLQLCASTFKSPIKIIVVFFEMCAFFQWVCMHTVQ